MLDLTPTSCKVNDLFIRESLARAEQHHALTRNTASAGKQPVARQVIRLPRISLFTRVFHLRPRPA